MTLACPAGREFFFFRHLDSSRLILFIGLATSELLRFSLIA
jgi:hypothetical protein